MSNNLFEDSLKRLQERGYNINGIYDSFEITHDCKHIASHKYEDIIVTINLFEEDNELTLVVQDYERHFGLLEEITYDLNRTKTTSDDIVDNIDKFFEDYNSVELQLDNRTSFPIDNI